MGKGEIARYEQFLLFPQCFKQACLTGLSKGVNVWQWVKKQDVCETLMPLKRPFFEKCNPDISTLTLMI